MIKLNSIQDHQVMLDRLNKIVTDGISKDQSRDKVLTEVLGVVIALEHGQEEIEAEYETQYKEMVPLHKNETEDYKNWRNNRMVRKWADLPVHPDFEDDITHQLLSDVYNEKNNYTSDQMKQISKSQKIKDRFT